MQGLKMRKVEAIHKNSLGSQAMNRITSEMSKWSRSNSFSSSSNDSAIFCPSGLKQPGFLNTKRLTTNKSKTKRNRNYSGSSSSSNFSSISDKESKDTPLLISTEAASSVKNTNLDTLKNLSNISSTALSLQHETLINDTIPKSIDMNSVHPFRHNLRRNIRKKTCSCDCTATCTTVVVSRQYKEIDQRMIEEKTVISRTKVKTFVERNTSPQFSSNETDETTFNNNNFVNSPNRAEPNRRRRSEIEKLYDSLHEIKWAKNFSPDNILRQLDVRQAASCSLFGKNNLSKSVDKTKAEHKQKVITNELTSPKTSKRSKINNSCSSSFSDSPYLTRNKSQRDKNVCLPGNIKQTSTMSKNKSYTNGHSASNSFSSQSETSPEKDNKDTINKTLSINSYSSIHNCFSSITNSDNFPKKCLSFDLKTEPLENYETVNDYTFFDITEGIHTIDSCFHEVGAEVVVSTCYESDLPLLTSEDENHLTESSVVNENPPILEPLCEESCELEKQDAKNHQADSSFRESEAEAVVPTCCKVDNDLPLLQSVENINLKESSNPSESPPTLEPHLFETSADSEKLPILNSVDKSSTDSCNSLETHSINSIPHKLKSTSIHRKMPLVSKPKSIQILNGQIKTGNLFKKKRNSISKWTLGRNSKDFKNNMFKNCKSNASQTKFLICTSAKSILKKYLHLYNSKHKKLPRSLQVSKRFNNCKISNTKSHSTIVSCSKQNPLNQHLHLPRVISSRKSFTHINVPHSSSKKLSFDSTSNLMKSSLKNTAISSPEVCKQAQETIVNSDGTTVIQTFKQEWLLTESPKKVTFNHFENSFYFHSDKESENFISNKKRVRKSSITGQLLESASDSSGYMKILSDSKKLQEQSLQVVKVPAKIFTCHYQTLNVTRGSNYIQIVLKITRGKAVFLTQESLSELKEAIDNADRDDDCNLLILNGFGQTFCLGVDLVPIVGSCKNQVVGEMAKSIKELISTLADFRKPLVAIVNGAAYGLGMTLLNHADVTLATSNASFCMPYSKLGYMPEGGASLTLPQTVGATVAMDLILRGQVITAQQAKEIGLINEVVELHELPQELVKRVKAIAENSLSGMETTKAMIKMRLHIQLPLVLEAETKLLPQMWLSPTCQEAIQNALVSGFLADY